MDCLLLFFLPNTNINCAWMKISNKQSRASIQRSSCSPHTCGSQSRCAGDSDTLPAAEPPPASSLPKWQCMVWRTAVHLDTRSPANEATWSSNYWKCMGSALNSCTPWHPFTCKRGNMELKLLIRQGECASCTPWHLFTCKWGNVKHPFTCKRDNVELKLLIRQGECAQQGVVWSMAAHLDTCSPADGSMWRSNYWKDKGSTLGSAWCEALLYTLASIHLQMGQCGAQITDKTSGVCSAVVYLDTCSPANEATWSSTERTRGVYFDPCHLQLNLLSMTEGEDFIIIIIIPIRDGGIFTSNSTTGLCDALYKMFRLLLSFYFWVHVVVLLSATHLLSESEMTVHSPVHSKFQFR